MKNIADGGGPAFPLKEPLSNDWQGMTLCDYFAGQALAGLSQFILAHSSQSYMEQASKQAKLPYDALLARIAYQLADAMMAERNKGGAA